MILIKKVGALTALALALSVPGALAAETPAPLNTVTAREQAVIDFQSSMATHTATVRALRDQFRTDLAAFQTAQSARQASIRPLADARQTAVAAANAAFTAAIANVTTQEGRDAVVKTRKDAITAAHATFKSAVEALGVAPVKPAKPTLPTKPVKPAPAPKAGN